MSSTSIVPINDTRRRRVVLSGRHVPTEAELARLDPADRVLLMSLFQEPFEYVHHELFDKPEAEVLVFGGRAEFVPGTNRFQKPGPEITLDFLGEGEAPTTAQEIAVFQQLNYARLRAARLLATCDEQGLDYEGIRELLAWVHRTVAIRDRLARLTLPLVPAMAKQARFQGLDFSDLISEGNCALLRAVMTFDCSKGYRFSTYACRAILKSFARVILRTTRYRNRFPVEFDPNREHGSFLDEKRDDEWAACIHELAAMLRENRAKLTKVELTVIWERFALGAPDPELATPKTLDEVGEMIGVTKERVRQIQMKALKKLRRDMEKNFLAA